jgi:hypothetical protein
MLKLISRVKFKDVSLICFSCGRVVQGELQGWRRGLSCRRVRVAQSVMLGVN